MCARSRPDPYLTPCPFLASRGSRPCAALARFRRPDVIPFRGQLDSPVRGRLDPRDPGNRFRIPSHTWLSGMAYVSQLHGSTARSRTARKRPFWPESRKRGGTGKEKRAETPRVRPFATRPLPNPLPFSCLARIAPLRRAGPCPSLARRTVPGRSRTVRKLNLIA